MIRHRFRCIPVCAASTLPEETRNGPGRSERRRVAHRRLPRRQIPQEAAHDFSTPSFRQRIGKADLVGLGERVTGGVTNLAPQIALLNELFEQFVKGQNPFNVELIWHRMFATPHDYRHPGMDRTPAMSAIEIALVYSAWNIGRFGARRAVR